MKVMLYLIVLFGVSACATYKPVFIDKEYESVAFLPGNVGLVLLTPDQIEVIAMEDYLDDFKTP